MKQALKNVLKSESFTGILLIACVIVSVTIANSPAFSAYSNLLTTHIGGSFGHIELEYTLTEWVNDGLMAIFFLLVGLEIKRELFSGELSSVKHAALPVFAALGGMIFPALIYFIANRGTASAGGWGIPMATDIAFAVAIIAILGRLVPSSLKIFLKALAIVDDLGAIIVIAIFYSAGLNMTYLWLALGTFLFQLMLNRLNVKNLAFYLIPGLFLWYFIHHSGIHATIAGVLTAFAIPIKHKADELPPLVKLEHALTNPVNFIIMPLFALCNTNIRLEGEMVKALITPLGLGIMLGLFIGKPVGITLLSWLATRLKAAQLPKGVSWSQIYGVGQLGGIGFTMSIFIALLSFESALLQNEARFIVLLASIGSAVAGYLMLNRSARWSSTNRS